jgi:hypothetical protein
MGVGLLSALSWCLEPYRQGLAEGGHDPSSARMIGGVDLIVSEDPERARGLLDPHVHYQADAYGVLRDEVERFEGRDPSPEARLGSASHQSYVILTPDEAVAHIRTRTQGLPVASVTPWLTVGGMPDDFVLEHIRLTTTRVAPALATD